jgi:hypothetical protein
MSSNTNSGRDASRGPAWWHIGVWLAAAAAALAACAPAASEPPAGSSPEPSTVGAATLGSNAGSPPAASPVTTSAAGAVPPLLEPQDLGPDWRVDEEVLRGDLGLGIVGNMCWDMYRDPSVSHASAPRTRVLTTRPASVEAAEGDTYKYVYIEVRRFEPGWSARHLAEWVGHMDKNCTLDPYTYQLTTIETGFAGDQSLLVLFTYGTTSKYLAVTRKGDLVVLIDAIPDRNLVRTAAVAATGRAR